VSISKRLAATFESRGWREPITSGKPPTYGDVVRQRIALNRVERFEKVPHGRYIGFRRGVPRSK